MKILVLGGTGAIGNPLVKILCENNLVYVTSRSEHQAQIIKYFKGDAHNIAFLKNIVKEIGNIDVIIDFLVYSTIEFKERVDFLLDSCEQYIYLSSCRVYADCDGLITEETPRIIDVIDDKVYLNTDEYALAKCRQEDLVKSSRRTNWTIVRPYITYNNDRLQLGFYEKEKWLYRVLNGKTILFPSDVGNKMTTMTSGRDVALAMSKLVGNKKAYGEIIQITQPQALKWKEIVEIYKSCCKKYGCIDVKVINNKTSSEISEVLNRRYQAMYDRLYNRQFDNSKLIRIIGEQIDFQNTEEGLMKCLCEFIQNPQFKINEISWKTEGYMDRCTRETTPMRDIPRMQGKIKYFIFRYTPFWKLFI